jgi:hypothetical protein
MGFDLDVFKKDNLVRFPKLEKRDDQCRQERENFWIKKLKTLSPHEINEK